LKTFAAELSLFARPGMVLLLKGDLGARANRPLRVPSSGRWHRGADFDVPSPTFTLIQTYEETRVPVAHADLYRINAAPRRSLTNWGWLNCSETHVLAVEWPEKITGLRGLVIRLLIELSGSGNHGATRC
jgi:N-acetylmuramate 1-kinase